MADDDPFVEFIAVAAKIVELHAVAAHLPVHRHIGAHAAVDEDAVLGLDNVRKGTNEVELRLEFFPQHRDERDKVRILCDGDALLTEHIPDKSAPAGEHIVNDVYRPILYLAVNGIRPAVAVAANGVDIAPLTKAHEISQRFKAVLALFQKVAVDDKLVVLRKSDFAEQRPEIRQVAVDIGHGDDAALSGIQLFNFCVFSPHAHLNFFSMRYSGAPAPASSFSFSKP